MPLLLYQILIYDMAITALAFTLEFVAVACDEPSNGQHPITQSNWLSYLVGSLLYSLVWPVRGCIFVACRCTGRRWLRWLFASSRKPSWHPEFL